MDENIQPDPIIAEFDHAATIGLAIDVDTFDNRGDAIILVLSNLKFMFVKD